MTALQLLKQAFMCFWVLRNDVSGAMEYRASIGGRVKKNSIEGVGL